MNNKHWFDKNYCMKLKQRDGTFRKVTYHGDRWLTIYDWWRCERTLHGTNSSKIYSKLQPIESRSEVRTRYYAYSIQRRMYTLVLVGSTYNMHTLQYMHIMYMWGFVSTLAASSSTSSWPTGIRTNARVTRSFCYSSEYFEWLQYSIIQICK